MKIIGVLGASGRAGRQAVSILKNIPGYKLMLISRDKKKVENLFKKEHLFTETDYSLESLMKITKTCTSILNCSGPAALVQKNVITACVLNGIDCIDISGGKEISEYILGFKKKSINNSFSVVGCGVYPGLTELLAVYGKKFFPLSNERIKMKGTFFARGEMSYSALYDFYYGIKNFEGVGMSKIEKGKFQQDFKGILPSMKGYPIGTYAYPIINYELEKMATKNDIEELRFYNIFKNQKNLIENMSLHSESQNIDFLVENHLDKEKQETESVKTSIKYVIQGNVSSFKMEIELESLMDGSELSGVVGALSLLYCIENGNRAPSLISFWEVIDPNWMVGKIKNYEVSIREEKKMILEEGAL